MWNVCWQCGRYRADKQVDPDGPAAVCPECGHRHLFRQLPLMLVSGASGAGKSTVCQALLGRLSGAILLDSDILLRPEFDTPENQYRDFFETWLRTCKNIGQSGRPVVLFGAGAGVPGNLEPCIERRYFSDLHYLALTCDDEVLVQRLEARPAWRGTRTPKFQAEQIRFNRWFKSQAERSAPGIELIDTTGIPVASTVERVAAWIRDKVAV
jgi:ribose 1,5-bisphosphokinase PhnN